MCLSGAYGLQNVWVQVSDPAPRPGVSHSAPRLPAPVRTRVEPFSYDAEDYGGLSPIHLLDAGEDQYTAEQVQSSTSSVAKEEDVILKIVVVFVVVFIVVCLFPLTTFNFRDVCRLQRRRTQLSRLHLLRLPHHLLQCLLCTFVCHVCLLRPRCLL